MTIFDTSVLFGTVDRNGENLVRSRRARQSSTKPFYTTEACLAEAMHLAGSRLGWNGQDRIWTLLGTYSVQIAGINF